MSNSTLQNVVILRWLFLIFHYMFYTKLHPHLANLTSTIWAGFAQSGYNRTVKLKTIELANKPQSDLENEIAKQANGLFEDFKKLNTKS